MICASKKEEPPQPQMSQAFAVESMSRFLDLELPLDQCADTPVISTSAVLREQEDREAYSADVRWSQNIADNWHPVSSANLWAHPQFEL